MYSAHPSASPTAVLTEQQSSIPSTHPTRTYSAAPSALPTAAPAVEHSSSPSSYPTSMHSAALSELSTNTPATQQSSIPSLKPSVGVASTATSIPTQTTQQIDASLSAESRTHAFLDGKQNEEELGSDDVGNGAGDGNSANYETNSDENESARDSKLEKNPFETPELVVTDTDNNARPEGLAIIVAREEFYPTSASGNGAKLPMFAYSVSICFAFFCCF
jgi:hypothetical protein